jgi:hypothetical protein
MMTAMKVADCHGFFVLGASLGGNLDPKTADSAHFQSSGWLPISRRGIEMKNYLRICAAHPTDFQSPELLEALRWEFAKRAIPFRSSAFHSVCLFDGHKKSTASNR